MTRIASQMLILLAAMAVCCGPRIDIHKAETLMKKGKWAEADSLLTGIGTSQAGSDWGQKAMMLKGCVQFKQGRLDDAVRTLDSARDARPRGEWADDAEYYAARVRFQKGEYQRAAEGFQRVLTGFGDDPKRSNCKALALRELESMEKRGLSRAHE